MPNGIAVKQTPFTAMLSPVRQRPASAGALTIKRAAPSVFANDLTVPVASINPVNILSA